MPNLGMRLFAALMGAVMIHPIAAAESSPDVLVQHAPVVVLPVGVTTTPTPRVEWRGAPHTAYQVLITDGPATSDTVIWDSGIMKSARNFVAATPELPTSVTLHIHLRTRGKTEWSPWSSDRAALFRVEPLPTPEGTLHTLNLRYTYRLGRKQIWDHVHLAVALQGIVNRDGPRVWIDYVDTDKTNRNVDAYWLKHLRSPGAWLSKKTVVAVPGLEALIALYRDRIKGAVVWDPEVPATSNLASTIAGADDLLPLRYDPSPRSLYTRLTAGHDPLPVVVNLTGKFTGEGIIPDTARPSTGSRKCDAYLWAVEHYLKSGRCDPRVMGYYIDAWWIGHPEGSKLIQNHTLGNHDYFISKRGFFWDLSPWGDETPVDDRSQALGTDLSTLKEILQAAYDRLEGREIIHVGGFTPWGFKYTEEHKAGGKHGAVMTEWETSRLLSAWNAFVDADALDLSAMANASAMTSMPLPRRYAQPPAPTGGELRRSGLLGADGHPALRTYLLHYIGDYDAAAWVSNSLFEIWDKPERGSVIMPWALNPNLSDRIPAFFEYAYRTRTGSDHFMAGDSGAGYVNPTQLIPPRDPSGLPSGVEAWQRHCRRYYQAFDYTFTGFLINGLAGMITEEAESLYRPFSIHGVVNQYGLNHAPVHLNQDRMPAYVMNNDLHGKLFPDAAVVHTHADEAGTTEPRFLVFRTILKQVSYIARLNRKLVASRPDLAYTFCDPKTFAYLTRAHFGADNSDLTTYLFDTVPVAMDAGNEYEFETAVRNDGWDTWRAGDGADDPSAHRLAIGFSANETAPEQVVWTSLPRDVPPGDAVVLRVRVTAPAEAGRTFLLQEMARGETRFSTRGGSPCVGAVTVMGGHGQHGHTD